MYDFFVGAGAFIWWVGRGPVGCAVAGTALILAIAAVGVSVAPVLACVNYGRRRRGRKALPITLGLGHAFDALSDHMSRVEEQKKALSC